MRKGALPVRLAALAMLAGAIGVTVPCCTSLSGDCALNLDCPGMAEPMCSDILVPGACDTCIQGYCCAELAACYADQECLYGCYQGFYPPDPDCASPPSLAPFQAILACQKKNCEAACAVTDVCNPVTGAGCSGTTCDAIYPGIFGCTGNTGTPAKLCAACDPVNGPFCDAELHCDPKSSTCARFCCTDADCGTGKCVLDQTAAFGEPLPLTTLTVGICLNQAGTSASCDAPPTAASNGTCAPSFM